MELAFKVAKAYQLLAGPDPHTLFVLSGGGLGGPNGKAQPGRVLKLDTSQGVVARSSNLQGASGCLLAGGWLWVTSRQRDGESSPGLLYQLNPTSLSIVREIAMPFSPVLAGGPNSLWIAGGGHLIQLDPATGAQIGTWKLAGMIEQLSYEPTGNLLYIATGKRDGETRAIEERDADTGLVISTRHVLPEVFWSSLSATRTGVWTSYASGMMGAVQFYDAAGLKPRRRGFQTGTNSITVGVMDGRVWIVDQQGDWMGCDTHRTGRLLSVWRMPASVDFLSSGVVTLGPLAYVASSKGIWSFNPAGPCGLAHRFPPFQP